MSMQATIYNTDMVPLSDYYDIDTDTDFDAVEQQAEELAASGTNCCIRWARASDGQVAYWGPRGATLEPYWYS